MTTRAAAQAAHFVLSFALGLPSSCSFAQVVVSAVRRAVTFNSMFSFFLHCLGSPLRATSTKQVPYLKPHKLYFNMIVPYQLPLTLKHIAVRLPRNTHKFSDFSQCEYRFSTNTNVSMVQHTNTDLCHSGWEDQRCRCANICHMALPTRASQCQYENSGTPGPFDLPRT